MTPDMARDEIEYARHRYQKEGDQLAVWDAISEAIYVGLPLPEWTINYLYAVAACISDRRYRNRPAPRQIASALAAAVLDPRAELDRMRFEDTRRALKQKRRDLQKAPASERRPLEQAIRDLERVIAVERTRVTTRRTGRNANPFAADDLARHEIILAMDVRFVLGDEWARDHASGHTPTESTYRRAGKRHRASCDVCHRVPSWKSVQRAWLRHRDAVAPPTARATRRPSKSRKV